MGASLVWRARELASIEEFLERIEAGPAALVLSGVAGIGKKTAVWEAGVERGLGRGARVLSIRTAER